MAQFSLGTQPVGSSPEPQAVQKCPEVTTVLSYPNFTPVQCYCSFQGMHFGGKVVQSGWLKLKMCLGTATPVFPGKHRKACLWQLLTLTHAGDGGDVHMTNGELQQKLLFSCTFWPFAFTLGHQAIIGWLTVLPSQHILSISKITDGILSHKCLFGLCYLETIKAPHIHNDNTYIPAQITSSSILLLSYCAKCGDNINMY